MADDTIGELSEERDKRLNPKPIDARIEAAARAWVAATDEWDGPPRTFDSYIAGATEEAARYARLVEAAGAYLHEHSAYRGGSAAAMGLAYAELVDALADLQVE